MQGKRIHGSWHEGRYLPVIIIMIQSGGHGVLVRISTGYIVRVRNLTPKPHLPPVFSNTANKNQHWQRFFWSHGPVPDQGRMAGIRNYPSDKNTDRRSAGRQEN
jgi:hypothetical protein